MSRLVIGTVQGIEGNATVVHADGSVDTLQSGARVFADDAITTQQNALVNIKFLDGSILNIGPQYTATLGKEIYDPSGIEPVVELADATPQATPAGKITHIGSVVDVDSSTMVIRADGALHKLNQGDLLYTNDIVQVGVDGHASIRMLDGSYMSFGPESLTRLDDDLFPSRYPDFVSSGITDATTIRAAILAGKDPADLTDPTAAGETGEAEDVGNSFVVLERTGRAVTPESGHETTGPTEAFGERIDELLPTDPGGDSVISISSANGVGAAVIEGGVLVFSVVLDKPNPGADVSATWTLNPGSADSDDFPPGTPFTGVVTIPAGATSATIEIPTLDDALFEGGAGTFEDVTLELDNVTNATPGNVTVTGIIEDNDAPPTVTITGDGALADAEAVEGTPLVFTLSLSNPSVETITLDLLASDGTAGSTDYNNTNFEVFDGLNWVPAGGADGTQVSFAPGQTELQVRVITLDDTIDEPNETMTLSVEGVVAGDVGDTTDTATGTIIDNDAPPTVTITGDGALADAEAVEGTPLVFTLSLSNPSVETITLDLLASDGTAGSTDYNNTNFEVFDGLNWVPAGGADGTQVSFAPGQMELQVRVITLDDAIDEPNETMTLGIEGVIAGDVGDTTDTATGTIIDNDAPPTVTITGDGGLADAEAVEGTPLVFTLSLSNPSVETITLDLLASDGTAGSADYNATNFEVFDGLNWVPAGGADGTQVSFAPGQMELQVRVITLDDAIDEPNETMTLGIEGVIAGDVGDTTDTATGTIIDNDAPPTVTITGDGGLADAEAVEGTPLVFTLSLSNPSVETITLDLLASDGTAGSADYNATNFEVFDGLNWVPAGGADGTQVSFAPGQMELQVRVITLDDAIDEPNETMTLGIEGVIAGDVGDTTDTATGTIIDNDAPPTVTITGDGGLADAEAVEGTPLVFTLSLSNPSVETITLDLLASDGTAGSADYNATNFEVFDGLNWVPAGGADGTQVSFAPGQMELQVRVITLDDAIDEPNETMTLGIEGVIAGDVGDTTDTATGTIIDNDAPPTVTITGDGGLADAEAVEGTPLVFTLSLSNPSVETITLDLLASDGTAGSADYNATNFEVFDGLNWVPAGGADGTQVSFAPGQMELQVRVITLDDAIDEPNETMTLEIEGVIAGDVGDTTDTATGTIIDNDAPPTVTITGDGGLADAEAVEGTPLVFTLSLSNPSVETITLDLLASDGTAGSADYNATNFEVFDGLNWVPAGGADGTQVSFAPGQMELQVRVITLDDAIDEPNETMTLEIEGVIAGDVGDTTDTATGTIIDNDAPPTVTITGDGGLADAEAVEGTPLVFTLSLSNPSVETITLDLLASDGTAGSADYNNTNFEVFDGLNWVPAGGADGTQVSFAPGQMELQVRVITLDDAIDEPNETMTLGIEGVIAGDVGDTTDTATGTIIDNDAPPTVTITGDGGLADAEAVEGTPLVFTLSLSNPSVETITLDLLASDGTAGSADYNNTNFEVFDGLNWVPAGGADGTQVSFAPGQMELQVRVITLDDAIDEPNETMTLSVEGVVAGDVGDTTDTATGTIIDNDILVTDNLFGQVTEAALFDGPGGNDDGSQDDPAQPAISTIDSGTLTFAGGELTGVSFDSGPAGDGVTDLSNADQFILEARDGAMTLWRLTVDKVEGVTPGGQIGDYNFTLLDNFDHPGSNLAFGDDSLQAQFTYTVTSPGGSESGSLTIDINDDRPDAVQLIADVGDAPIVTNLVVVLDRSGSMNNHPNGDTSAPTRLELAKAAIADLLTAWSDLGMVNVMVIDFAGSASHATDGATDPWLTADQANVYVQGITANSVTNYQLAAEEVISLFPGGSDPGAVAPPEADQSYVYWLTDGLPNRGDLNESEWTDFLLREDFTAAYGVGVGRDISALDADLQEVAWPNDTEFSATNPDGNLIVVGDARDLGDTLVNTVVNRVDGNILDDALPDSTFGADGPGQLLSLTVDGVTYTYDPAAGIDGTITPDNRDPAIAGSILSADTPLGGNLIFHFDTGDYSYAIPQVSGTQTETFTYSVVDADGDASAAPNEFIIHIHPVDDVINGTAGADILTGGDGNELIIGNGGDDTIAGGAGNDVIRGGLGSDDLTGDAGADTFVIRGLNEGKDTIHDYNSAESDILDISDILTGYEPGVDVIGDFVNVAADGTVAVNPNPLEPGSTFTDIAVLSNISPGATIIIQVTEDMTETLTVIA